MLQRLEPKPLDKAGPLRSTAFAEHTKSISATTKQRRLPLPVIFSVRVFPAVVRLPRLTSASVSLAVSPPQICVYMFSTIDRKS
jgi:hypothetical protein